MAIEEPEYEVVQRFDDFELRRYAPQLVAEVEVEGGFDRVGYESFRLLAAFIGGKNRAESEVAMTAPVVQEPASSKIAMTAPVTQQPVSAAKAASDPASEVERYAVRFVMPAKYTRESLPVPTDPRVQIRELPAREIAARRYSGFWSEGNFRDNEQVLRRGLAAEGFEPAGPALYARYNSPFSLWFLRRNEVMIEVRSSR